MSMQWNGKKSQFRVHEILAVAGGEEKRSGVREREISAI
jgi:hypothetical protein